VRVDSIAPILNVSDMRASINWFETLGWRTGFTWGEPPTFASVVCGDPRGSGEIFLCLNGQGARGVWMSWFVPSHSELYAAYARARELGYEISREPADEPWRIREFHLRHPDGHTFRVGCENRG
jgi:catechol 2,3-dioxygenase-like lactoylglutathione lyase family enzyme